MMQFSILVLLTKQRYSSFFKKVFVLQKICFKVKVWKTFKTSTDCLIKTCRSLKWRVILKIPSIVYSFLDKLTLRSWISRSPTYFFEKASNCTQANVDTFTSLGSKQTKKPLPPPPPPPLHLRLFQTLLPRFLHFSEFSNALFVKSPVYSGPKSMLFMLALKWNLYEKVFSSVTTKTNLSFAVKLELVERNNHSFLLSI